MDGPHVGDEPRRQDQQAGRDGYIAGRDQTINNYHLLDREEYLAEREVLREDQARRVVICQDHGSRTVDHLKAWLSTDPDRRVGFVPLPTRQTYRFVEVSIANHSEYVIHDVEVEWKRGGAPTGRRAACPEILPGTAKQLSMPGLEDHEEPSQFSAVVRFRDKDNVLRIRDAASG